MEPLPRLGDSLTECSRRLGQPVWSQARSCVDGLLVQQSASRLGLLTILWDHDRSVAPQRCVTTRLRPPAHLAPDSRGTTRLLIDAKGWLLVAAACTGATVQHVDRAALSAAHQAELAA